MLLTLSRCSITCKVVFGSHGHFWSRSNICLLVLRSVGGCLGGFRVLWPLLVSVQQLCACEYHANVSCDCPYRVSFIQVSLKTFDALSGDMDDDVELTADWFPSTTRAVCAMDQSRFLCYDEENALLRHAVLGKQVMRGKVV